MSCSITNRTIFTWLMKIGMTSYPQSKSKIIGKGQHQDQEDYNLERSIILTAMNLFGVFKRRGLVMVYKSKSKSKRHTSITVKSAIVYFSRRQEFLSKSICRMSMKTVLESVPTRSSSRMYWEDLYEVGTMLWHCIQSLNIDRRRSWRLLRKKQILYSISKNYGSRHELKNIKNIWDKSSKKRYNYISDYSSNKSYSDSSLIKNSDWDKKIKPDGRKEINILYHIVNYNKNQNQNQRNDVIENDPKLDNIFNLSSGTKYPLPVVTVSLQEGKKQGETTVAGITCL